MTQTLYVEEDDLSRFTILRLLALIEHGEADKILILKEGKVLAVIRRGGHEIPSLNIKRALDEDMQPKDEE